MSRIAMCGVFDIANYGDHLFPAVMRSQLSKRGIEDEVILFSPFTAPETFVKKSQVYSLSDLERMHQEDPFSAIIVGGGEIIHWYRFGQRLRNGSAEYEEYPMAEVWTIPWMMKLKYGIPLIWNAPGIPFELPNGQVSLKSLFSNIDYLSVRNNFSAQALTRIGIDKSNIKLIPDTGFALGDIATKEELSAERDGVLPFKDRYIVFHCNRFLPQNFKSDVVNFLLQMKSSGYGIVLLPLAYTHGDDEVLHELNDLADGAFFIPEGLPSLVQIISILAGCELYVGTSLHGSVTAAAFEKPTIAFDYQETKKTKDLYRLMGRDDFYLTTPYELLDHTDKAFKSQTYSFLSGITRKLSIHFDAIAELLSSGEPSDGLPKATVAEAASFIEGYLYDASSLASIEKALQEAVSTQNHLLREKDLLSIQTDKLKSSILQERTTWLEEQQRLSEEIEFLRLKNLPKRLLRTIFRHSNK